MKVFVNNKEYEAVQSETIIELTDRLGIHVPRFCYHKHLSVVASCRMCLVDIEGINHAQPACSTALTENMKIFTTSKKTKSAQKSTMEFLLINHPLDCPICDQGGECELQDISLEYGKDHSQYMQFKRVVVDKDISPLISTDMTRCIHCSRCVRFGEEVSANKELGLLDRGEHMVIDAFIESGVSSELSGNMIDLCPVGALNNKPYRYKARTWDLSQYKAISPHDCIGSNIYYHTYNNKIIRAVPMENSNINQTWISDRDRFGYEGIYSNDRVLRPMIRENGKLVECETQTIVESINKNINFSIKNKGTKEIGCLITPQSTSEELYLFQKLFKGLDINNIDHRTNECDFGYQDNFPIMPSLGCDLKDIDNYDNIILMGVNIKSEFPILSIRLNAATKIKTKIFSLNFDSLNENFPLHKKIVLSPDELIKFLNIKNNKSKLNIGKHDKTLIILGPSISQFNNQSEILFSIKKYSDSVNAKFGFLTDHCNSTSAWLLGALPHRNVVGKKNKTPGLDAYNMIEKRLSSYIFFNLEPENDFWNNISAIESLKSSTSNIFFSSFITPAIEKYADILIPITTFAETDGSFINIEGVFQSYKKIVKPSKNIFTGWSILNELLKINNLGDYSMDSLRKEIQENIISINLKSNFTFKNNNKKTKENLSEIFKLTKRETYYSDPIVRRSPSLQATVQAKSNHISISPDIVKNIGTDDNIEIINDPIKHNISSFEIKSSLPINTIVYPSSKYHGKLIGPKSGYINIKS